MHWLWFIALVTVCFTGYATLNRAFAANVPAIHGVTVLIGTSFLVLLTLALFVDKKPLEATINYWPFAVMGLLIAGLNAGYVYAFAHGAPVSLGPAIANIISAVLLALIGYFLFKEHLSPAQMLGIAFGVVSIGLIAKG